MYSHREIYRLKAIDLPSQDSKIWTTSPICRGSCDIPVPLKLYIAEKVKDENTVFSIQPYTTVKLKTTRGY